MSSRSAAARSRDAGLATSRLRSTDVRTRDAETRRCRGLRRGSSARARAGHREEEHCDRTAGTPGHVEHMEPSAAPPPERAGDPRRVLPVDDAPQPRQAQRVDVLAALDAHPAPPHLVRHRRGRAAAEERVEDPVAGVGRHREDAREEPLGLLVPDEARAAFARDALEGDVVPDVRERLDEDARARRARHLVGEEEHAVAAAEHEVLAPLALQAKDPRRARGASGR